MLALPLRVRSLKIFKSILFEVPQARRYFIDQIVVVGDQQDGAFVALEGDIERVDGFKVEMVRGLVEDENVGLGQNQLAEHQSRLLAAGERLGLLLTLFAGEEHLAEDAADLL